jgi:nitrogen fixation/metabolism regulation signal transduction histidine kinase
MDEDAGLSRRRAEEKTFSWFGCFITPLYTTKMVGTGMGLTLVKRIVEDHGGSLTLENRKEGGRATVVLPRVEQNGERLSRMKGVKKGVG